MKPFDIRISTQDIYGRTFTESGYLSRSRSAMGLPDAVTENIQATDDDRRVIDRYIVNCIDETAQLIGRYMSPCTVRNYPADDGNNVEYTISFQLPHNYPDGVTGQLQAVANDIVTDKVLQYWYLLMKPDEAGITGAKVQNDTARMRELLALREYPRHTNSTQDNVIEL